jgi:hypothetical protein
MPSLAPTARAKAGVRRPLVAPAFPSSSDLQPSVAMTLVRNTLTRAGCPLLQAGCSHPNNSSLTERSARREPAVEAVLLRHEVVVRHRGVTRPELSAPTVVELGR